jgi:hypothetical protein
VHKRIYGIAEKLAVRDKSIKKLLDADKAVREVIEKIIEVIHSSILDSEKITKVEAIVDTLETGHLKD